MSTIELSKVERVELTQRATSQAGRADDARRARLILLLEAGNTWTQVREKLSCNDAFIDRWTKRFAAERLAGLFSRHAGQEASALTPALEARILEWTVKRKPAGSSHWSTRKLAEQLGVSHMMVARVWRKHSLKPQRMDSYVTSDDPDFEKKAADIIALYLHPPQHAAVFCVDEKTAIQALDRLDPVLRCLLGGVSGTALSTTDTVRSPSTPPSTPRRARCWGKPLRGTLRPSSWPS
jgi:transposase